MVNELEKFIKNKLTKDQLNQHRSVLKTKMYTRKLFIKINQQIIKSTYKQLKATQKELKELEKEYIELLELNYDEQN